MHLFQDFSRNILAIFCGTPVGNTLYNPPYCLWCYGLLLKLTLVHRLLVIRQFSEQFDFEGLQT